MRIPNVSPPFVLILLAAGMFLVPTRANAQDQNVLDEIAAVVDNEVILHSEVDGLTRRAMMQRNVGQQNYADIWTQALNELVNQKVLAAHARRDTTIRVTDEQVAQQLDQRINQMVQQMGGEERLEETYGKSLPEIKAEVRQDFRSRLLAQQFQQRKMNKISITPSEVRAWFERIPADSLPTLPEAVRVAHIVRYPKATQAARQQARDKLASLRDSIVAGGASFEEIARRYSDHTTSASRGGLMQGFNVDDLLPEFSAVASRLSEGEVSQIFKTTQGYHIMRLNERRGDEIDFNHILLKVDERQGKDQQAIERLNAIRDSIVTQDIPFQAMARRYSEEESSAQRGGQVVDPASGRRDLPLEQLSPSWQRTLRSLDEGEISEPAQVALQNSRTAYHIVKLQQHQPAHTVSLETDYDRIRQLALQEKKARKLQAWLDRLREDVYVDIRVDPSELSASRF